MRKRILSFCMALAMCLSLVPASAIPVMAAPADDAEMTVQSSGSTGEDFGIVNEEMSDEERANKLKHDPFGRGQDNYFTMFEVSELGVYRGDGNYREFKTTDHDDYHGAFNHQYPSDDGVIGQKGSGNNNGIRFADTVAGDFDGDGRNDQVAAVQYWAGGKKLELIVLDKYGNRVGRTHQLSYGGDKDNHDLEFLDSSEAMEYGGFMSIAAGDFDGDGKDSIVVYCVQMRNQEPNIQEFALENGNLTFKGYLPINVFDLAHISRDAQKDSMKVAWMNKRDTPRIHMVASDTDSDGVDELVITTSLNDPYIGGQKDLGSSVYVYDKYKKNAEGADFAWNQTACIHSKDNVSGFQDAKRLRYATSDVGDVIAGGNPEIVTAGWVDFDDDGDIDLGGEYYAALITSCNRTKPAENAVQSNGRSAMIGEYSTTLYIPGGAEDKQKASNFMQWGMDNSSVLPNLPVTCFAPYGKAKAEAILIGDTVFEASEGKLVKVHRGSYYEHDDRGIDSNWINRDFVLDSVAGNFDGNKEGREQVIMANLYRQKGNAGVYFTNLMSYECSGSGNIWSTNNAEGQDYITYDQYYAFVSLSAPDVDDDDSVIVALKDVSRHYTEPDVLAILEAAPYFAEIDGGEVGNSATTFGHADVTAEGVSKSNGMSTNITTGFDWEMDDVTLGFACGAGFEATMESNYTWETSTENSVEYSIDYSNDTGDNKVVVFQRPVDTFKYEEKDTGNVMVVGVMGDMATNIMTVDEYNAAVRGSQTLKPITDGMLATPGDPFSYRASAASSGKGYQHAQQNFNAYRAESTITQAINSSSSTQDSFSYEHSFAFSAYGAVMGVKAGAGAGYTHGETNYTIKTNDINRSGAVTGHNVKDYDFNWRFAHWTVNLGSGDVPVLGYEVKDVMAPPTPPENLRVEDIQSTTATLMWDPSGRPADSYRIYQYFEGAGTGESSYMQIGEVAGDQNTYQLKNLLPSTSYQYVVRSYAAPKAGETGGGVRGQSVPSGEASLTTTPVGAEPVTAHIIQPQGNESDRILIANVAPYTSTTFAVDITVPGESIYSSATPKWQILNGFGTWSDIPDAEAKTLKIDQVTPEMDGNQYRCKVNAVYGSSYIPYYSEIVTLRVGKNDAYNSVTVEDKTYSQATIEKPYVGKASAEIATSTKEVTSDVQVPVKVKLDDQELPVYQQMKTVTKDKVVEMQPLAVPEYYALDAKTGTYYKVTLSGSSYALGSKVVPQIRADFYGAADSSKPDGREKLEAPVTPAFTKQITMKKDKTTYLLVAVLGTPVFMDGRLDQVGEITPYWMDFMTGKLYEYIPAVPAVTEPPAAGKPHDIGKEVTNVKPSAAKGFYDVYYIDAKSDATPVTNEFIIGKDMTYEIPNPEHEEDSSKPKTLETTGYWFTKGTFAPDSGKYAVTSFQKEEKTVYQADGAELVNFNPGIMQDELRTEKETNTVPVNENVSGTALTLKAKVVDNEQEPINVPVEFIITNVATGKSETLFVDASNVKNGVATIQWTASAPGLYSIQSANRSTNNYVAGNRSKPVYYRAEQQFSTVWETKDKTEYRLVATAGNQQLGANIVFAEGINATLKLEQRVSTLKDGKWVTGKWTDANVKPVYKASANIGGQRIDKTLDGSSTALQYAGGYTFAAYPSAEADIPYATSTVNVQPKPIVIKPVKQEANPQPIKAEQVDLLAEDQAGKTVLIDKLRDIIDIKCYYFDHQDATGHFVISLGYHEYDAEKQADLKKRVDAFKRNYDVTFGVENFNVAIVGYQVIFEAGENGAIDGRYGDTYMLMNNPSTRYKGDYMDFVAKPDKGYVVDKWLINGTELSEENAAELGVKRTAANKIVVDAFDPENQTVHNDAANSNEMKVSVTFRSAENQIDYSVYDDVGGALSATVSKDTSGESELQSGTKIALGSKVTFTAAPDQNYLIQNWKVNDVVQTNEDGTPYRGETLVLEDVREAKNVVVTYVSTENLVPVHTDVYDDQNKPTAGATVSLSDPYTKEPITSVKAHSDVTFTADLASLVNNMVKEWQVSNDGEHYTTVAGSGAQSSITLRDISAETWVRAIVTTEQSYTLQWNITGDVPAGTELTAKSKGVELKSGDAQSAYIPVDFVLTLNDNYYVTGWSTNVTQSDTTDRAASLASLTDNMTVTVNVAEKPVVTIPADLTGGSLKVEGVLAGEKVTIETGSTHVDFKSDVTITATPASGYVWNKLQTAENTDKVNGGKTVKEMGVEAAFTVNAVFAEKSVVTVNTVEGGTVTVTGTVDGKPDSILTNGAYVDFNSTIKVVLKPTTGYEVANTNAGIAYTDGDKKGATTDDKSYTVDIEKVKADQTVTPNFVKIPQYTVNFSVVDTNGDKIGDFGTLTAAVDRKGLSAYAVSGRVNTAKAYRDSKVTLTAQPDEGYRVMEWIVDGKKLTDNTSNTLVLDITDADKTVTVQFMEGSRIRGLAGENGKITSAKIGDLEDVTNLLGKGFTLVEGASLNIVAVPDTGYEVEGWYINDVKQDGTEQKNTFTYTATNADAGANIAVKFRQVEYSVSFGGANGTVKITAPSEITDSPATIRGGTAVTFTAVPNSGYVLSGWTVNGEKIAKGADNTLTWTVPNGLAAEKPVKAYDVKAVFAKGAYTLTIEDTANGTVTANRNDLTALPGATQVTLTAHPEKGYIVESWSINGGEPEMTRTTSKTLTITADTTVKVVFVPAEYTVSFSVAGENGTVKGPKNAADSVKVPYDGSVTLTAAPNEFYMVNEWIVDGKQSGTETTLTLSNVKKDTVVTVSFKKAVSYDVSYQVQNSTGGTLSATENGENLVLKPDQMKPVYGNSKLVFTAAPAAGQMVKKWTINGTTVTRENAEELGLQMEHQTAEVLTINSLNKAVHVTVEYEAVNLFAIPGSSKDYTVTVDSRAPMAPGSATQIRRGGDVTFTITPAKDKTFETLKVNGVDCLNFKAEETAENRLTVKKNGSSFTVTLQNVTKNIVLTAAVKEAAPSGGGGGGGGGFVVADYDITVKHAINGTVTASAAKAPAGKTIELTVEAKTGKILKELKVVTAKDGAAVEVTEKNGKYTFKMPGEAVIVSAQFQCLSDELCPSRHLKDVNTKAWYHEAVDYVVENSIMKGVAADSFAPNVATTRAMIVTMLYRMENEPAVTSAMTFADVAENQWYTEAVRWAAANGIVEGYNAQTFGPMDSITREQMAAILYRYAKYKEYDLTATSDLEQFEDLTKISTWAADAMKWANTQELINGVSDTEIRPKGDASRAEVAAIIMRFCEFVVK